MVASRALRHPGPDPRLYAALRGLPGNVTGEILNGRLIATPRPATPHLAATSRLGAALSSLFEFGWGGGPGGWVFLDEPELHLGRDVLVPDLAGWRKSRMAEPPRASFLTLAPDWVCEGISASTEVDDRRDKVPAYASHGVKHAWLIDAEAHSLEVFRNDKGTFRPLATFKGDARVRAEPFAAIELDLSLFWLHRVGKRRRGKV